ncbi:hypothetical protein HanLR1_Chr10g0372321 [Helianthus annuus]|nr:hypothetical protein HanLR1_Chr10g0372321 [Helianthus annuus]
MAPKKDNHFESVSVLTQRQLDKFVRDYRIPTDLHPVLPAKDKTIYPFLPGKFSLYTRVCNFANYRVPFTKFLIKVLQFFRVHLCQVNPFGLSRVNHFEISCRALNQKPDLNVFRYFYEFITAGDWYTFAHRKGIPSPAGDEKSSLKNWKDNFFWLDDRCLPAIWYGGDKMSLRDALKVPSFPTLDFDYDEIVEDEDPFFKQIASAAQEIRPRTDPKSSEAPTVDPESKKEVAGSSVAQVRTELLLVDEDSDPEVRELDHAFIYPSSAVTSKGKGVSSSSEPKGLLRKRKIEIP